jgi:uncharacterized membrane protein YphA (DoxX/SURF4 family)
MLAATKSGKREVTPLIKSLHPQGSNSWIELAARWVLGCTFVYASFHKILAPAEFARIVYRYDLFPPESINLIAITVPWLELFAGAALITCIYPRSAVLIINAMLTVFIVILSINLWRGHTFDCGCLSSGGEDYINSAGQWIVRDLVLLILGIYIFTFDAPRNWCWASRCISKP